LVNNTLLIVEGLVLALNLSQGWAQHGHIMPIGLLLIKMCIMVLILRALYTCSPYEKDIAPALLWYQTSKVIKDCPRDSLLVG
jgi:hypothetical protein